MSDRTSMIAEARAVLRGAGKAALGTLGAQGAPFVSLATPALRIDGTPLLLLSDLAVHTKNLRADPRVALMFEDTAGRADPMTGPRLSLTGQATLSPSEDDRRRYLARYPAAELYARLPDFRVYEVALEDAVFVAGFGRARSLPPRDILHDAPSAIGPDDERAIIDHMNDDHADAVAAYATGLLSCPPGAWRMTGIDPDGADLRLDDSYARLPFPTPATSRQAMRETLVDLARKAREKG